jgi:phosphatidylserine decarboxylase
MVLITFFIVILFLFVSYLIFWKAFFLRDPQRKIPAGNYIIAPADGKIIRIIPLDSKKIDIEKGLLGAFQTMVGDMKKGYLVSIFMSPFDVHVNRAPADGKIVSVTHFSGNFFKADNAKAFSNERTEIILDNKKYGRIKVIMIAGFVARRIECFVKEGESVKKGDRIGRINLGSQVSLILPQVKIAVHENQFVKAGESIIAGP